MTLAPERAHRSATEPLLAAPTPRAWLDEHLHAHLARHDGPDADSHRWVTYGELLDGGLARLHAEVHAREGGTTQMVAKWVVTWTAGRVADVVGFVLAAGGAGLLADTVGVGGDGLRWRQDPEGWADRLDVRGATLLVTPEHPWARLADVPVPPGQHRVELVADEAELVTRTVDALVRAVRPLVDAVRGLARVGARALWAEVADEVGMATLYQPQLPVRDDAVARLQAALQAPGAPWRVSPSVRTVSTSWGRAYLGQKGGCCLAYQRPDPDPVPDEEMTDALREYHARFPPERGTKRVCTTCSLRDPAGCAERQLWWLEKSLAT
ncbi:hypothetical protein [Aquipuribacter nitratireducens]|uniref:Uncharacterized protein n=1 Tax=Aquipuribacter nitratireducens TaxID=650104 RepID=A0ABW0GPP0_9MICO